jgi:hypothetical protein
VDGKFPRHEFQWEILIGDPDGCFIRHVSKGENYNHAKFLRLLIAEGFVENEDWDVVSIIGTPDVKVIGTPKSVNFAYSGIILPRQAGVDSTYVSLWTALASPMVPFLTRWVKAMHSPPYLLEINETNDLLGRHFKVTAI